MLVLRVLLTFLEYTRAVDFKDARVILVLLVLRHVGINWPLSERHISKRRRFAVVGELVVVVEVSLNSWRIPSEAVTPIWPVLAFRDLVDQS